MHALLKGSPLAYPGRAPGFDPSHPAAQGIVFSGIGLTSKSFLRVDQSAACTINGSPSGAPIDGALGPCFQPNTSNNGGSAAAGFSISTPASSFATVAAIVRPLSVTGGTNEQCFTTNTQAFVILTSSGALDVQVGGSNVATGLSLVAGTPYFIAASIVSASKINVILLNLSNGSLSSATITTSNSIASGTGIYIGNSGGYNKVFGGNIAAVMYSTALLSLQQLIAWAADPWAFWYPRGVIESLDWLAGLPPAATLSLNGSQNVFTM